MPRKIVVHTGVGPEDPRVEETRILNVPHVEFVKRGPCETPQEVLEAVRDADVAICIGEPYSREVLANVPRLMSVVRIGVGVDTVDLDAATENGIVVAYFPDFCTREVANHAIALLLACAEKVLRIDRTLRHKGWDAARQLRSPMGSIHDETLGLLGLGAIGRETARLAQCMGMRVIASDPYVDISVFEENGVRSVSLEELAAEADYVSCHVPLNEGTRGLVDASFFGLMKPTAYFINTSRGAVVEEPDLVVALQDGRIAGAGLDVFVEEPIPSDHPFLTMDNVVLTAHTAPYADETYRVRDRRVAHSVLTILQGDLPPFVANPEVIDHRRT